MSYLVYFILSQLSVISMAVGTSWSPSSFCPPVMPMHPGQVFLSILLFCSSLIQSTDMMKYTLCSKQK